MAFRPFGKDVGPSMNTRPSVVRPSFGHLPRPPSITLPTSGPQIQRAPSPPLPSFRPYQPSGVQRGPEPDDRTPSPPLALQHSRPSVRTYQFSGLRSGPEAPKKFPSTALAFQNPIVSVRPYQSGGNQRTPEASQRFDLSPPTADAIHPAASPNPFTRNHQSNQDGNRSFLKENGVESHPRPAAGRSYVISRSSGDNAAEIGPSQDKRTAQPHSFFADEDVLRNSPQPILQSHSDFPVDRSSAFHPRKRSPQSAFGNNQFGYDFYPPSSQTQRPSSSSIKDNLARLPSDYPNRLTHQDRFPNAPYIDSFEAADMQAFRSKRSLPTASSHRVFQDNSNLAQNNQRRSSISPSAFHTRLNTSFDNSDSHVPEGRPLSYSNDILDPTSRTTSSPAPKRIRSPLHSDEDVFLGNSGSSQDGTEREDQAKAKRLARFKGELGRLPIPPVDTADTKFSVNKTQKPSTDKQNVNVEPNRDAMKADTMSDNEGLGPPSVIIGLCPDMCPEYEREERERKGDLDKFERVDGDRNQTSKCLAVKKYNRTAEREAILIRPMPILQKTMNYLLDLLDQPYDDSFLSMYNFLWDRMRAIRMDLRMQHIFNEEAITMLEQMIRLHIIAMHELCEYTKGEGFSEGFDAHLNIEQMNKTSVELFQMYDDHRKRGINIPTEREFRGYYALLKLDRHPGYKVEPAELSLDLARMTPEIRQTPEVLFARNVARACRTGNFIAFFRLARKASYLQACLMHAHFAKLRTQALAALFSGLLNNQGLPVSDVSKWIAMEEEDIEMLLDYHGFSTKEFEEPYIMKDGPFLNADKDYPTRCSKLVHLKKSRRIVEDVSPPSPLLPLPSEAPKETEPITPHKHDPVAVLALKKQSSFRAVDEEMPKSETSSLPKEGKPSVPLVVKLMADQRCHNDQGKVDKIFSPRSISSPLGSPRFSQASLWSVEKPSNNFRFSQAEIQSTGNPNDNCPFNILSKGNKFPVAEVMPMKIAAEPVLQESSPKALLMQIMPGTSIHKNSPNRENEYSMVDLVPQGVILNDPEDKEPLEMDQENENENGVMTSQYDKEVAEAKLKLIIRLWKRWSSRQRKFREKRQLAASAALNSLSLGPPIRLTKDDQPSTSGEFDIDQARRKRFEKHEQSWSRLNVSDVTVGTLSKRIPDSNCICWKIVLCSQMKGSATTVGSPVNNSVARQWLLSKLIPSKENEDKDDDLLHSSPGVSIWKKWVPRQSGSDLMCCLSVVRNLEADDGLHETVSGASGILFLVSEGIPWSLQKNQLNNLLNSVPSGSCLPLLIVSDSYNQESSDPSTCIVKELGLHYIDKSRVSSFSVLSLVGGGQRGKTDQFFSDKRLREGLQWLASTSPVQPVLHSLKIRQLVLSHLSFSLDLLGKIPDTQLGPNLCISAFNEALDWALGNIVSAAESNPVNWPCPEIKLLEGSRNEHLMVKLHLPSMGWSSAERIEPLKSALKNFKLPSFHDGLTWMTMGCGMVAEVENQRLRLESCLVEYLTQTSKLMEDALAAKEAFVMLQRNTRLELHNSSYYIIPKWAMIFRRIFNWQLMGLSNMAISSAYVLKSDFDTSTLGYLDRLEVEDDIHLSSLPSLDEIIGIDRSQVKSTVNDQAMPDLFKSLPVPSLNDEAQEAANTGESMDNRHEFLKQIDLVVGDDIAFATSEFNTIKGKEAVDTASVGADRLSELLEKCNMVQNNIAKKLSIYY